MGQGMTRGFPTESAVGSGPRKAAPFSAERLGATPPNAGVPCRALNSKHTLGGVRYLMVLERRHSAIGQAVTPTAGIVTPTAGIAARLGIPSQSPAAQARFADRCAVRVSPPRATM